MNESSAAQDQPTCDYCGWLDWTIEKYGRVTHKQSCPHRPDPWHQGDPKASAATEFPDGFEWSDEEERPVVTYYTAREVAEALGVVERSVRRWIEDGKLPAEKVGGAFRIRMEDARRVYSESRSGYREGRAHAEARVHWLEAENERLWRLLEKVVERG